MFRRHAERSKMATSAASVLGTSTVPPEASGMCPMVLSIVPLKQFLLYSIMARVPCQTPQTDLECGTILPLLTGDNQPT